MRLPSGRVPQTRNRMLAFMRPSIRSGVMLCRKLTWATLKTTAPPQVSGHSSAPGYEGVTAFDHRRVRLRQRLGWLPPMTIVGLDGGGVVDTVAFNRTEKPFHRHERREFDRLLAALIRAIERSNLPEVGRIATRSAQLNERLPPKRTLAAVAAAAAEIGALGVVVTHSGPMIGMLFVNNDPMYTGKCTAARQVCWRVAGNACAYTSLSRQADRVGHAA